MLHISEFRVQKYADKGGFPLSHKILLSSPLVFDWLYGVNNIQDNEWMAC